MRREIIIVLLFVFSFQLSAQVSYIERIEFELKDDFIDENLIEFGEKGFLVRSRNKNTEDNKIEWKYELFNSNLKSEKSKSIKLNKKYKLVETFNSEDRTHSVFKDRKGNYTIVSVDASTLEIVKVEGVVSKKTFFEDMSILGNYAFFNTTVKREPFLFSVNWKTGEKKFIPINISGYKRNRVSINSFQLLERSKEIFVYVSAQTARKNSDIHILRLNENGEKIESFNLTKSIDKNLISISASEISNNKYVFTGTYSTTGLATSEGIFICQGQNSQVDFIKFYNFTDLKEFMTYLPERRQKKIEKKKKRKEARGKEYKINYRIADHEIISVDDGFILLGEAYYPTYTTTTQTISSTSASGTPIMTTQTTTVFDGYRYTHALLAKFSKNGDILWDKTFEMWPMYKPFRVKRFISIAEQNENSLKMVFANKNNIVSKSVGYNGYVIQDEESKEIETGYAGDKSKHSFTNIDYWYDNFFLAYGTQKIKNKTEKNVKRKRKVYFVSKIRY